MPPNDVSDDVTDDRAAHGQVRIERHYAVAPGRVWQAWTEAAALSAWFGAPHEGAVTEATIDLRVGGRYRIVSRLPDGNTHEVGGEYQVVDPVRRLVFSWAWRSTPERVSRVSLALTPQDGGTHLCFVHDQFFDAEACRSHGRGWAKLFDCLDGHLSEHHFQTVTTKA